VQPDAHLHKTTSSFSAKGARKIVSFLTCSGQAAVPPSPDRWDPGDVFTSGRSSQLSLTSDDLSLAQTDQSSLSLSSFVALHPSSNP